jgi:hypothetical protein
MTNINIYNIIMVMPKLAEKRSANHDYAHALN